MALSRSQNVTMILNNSRQFLRENGVYVFMASLVAFCFAQVRNRMIARKLNVKKISIGPGSYLRGLSFVEMGEDFSAGQGLWLEAIARYNKQSFSPRIVIGNHVRISHWTHIASTHYIEIGDNVLMGSKVIVTDHNHGQYANVATSPQLAPALRPLDRDGKVVIGSNVWLGDGVIVMPGSAIGEGCVIGANSVVKGTIPPFTIAAGAPARVVRVFDFDKNEWIGPR